MTLIRRYYENFVYLQHENDRYLQWKIVRYKITKWNESYHRNNKWERNKEKSEISS